MRAGSDRAGRATGGQLLRLEGVRHRFGGLVALDGVDLDVRPGELCAIVGPNGAGKTTLFNVMSGFLQPTEGRVFLEDRDVTGLPAHRVSRLGVTRTFQATRLFEGATALDNVMVGGLSGRKGGVVDGVLQALGLRTAEGELRDRAKHELEFVGADHVADTLVGEIRQEDRRCVAIAMALATAPSLLLLDEPVAGVGPDGVQRVGSVIRRVLERGITVCLIEHRMRMVMELADRVVVMDRGSLIASGSPQEVVSDPVVIEAYLGVSTGTPAPDPPAPHA